ncbi:MAG: heparinase II/III family protein, partial [Candidatus Latescibacteria bacterium]|nr:heparinase II/III family protein [Candidatus Latescibacterota bacterium]
MAIGVVIEDKGFVDQALNSPYSGFHALAARVYDSDGFAWEGFGYHTYTVSGLSPIAEMAYRVGINVYDDPNYRRIFEAPPRMLLPGEEAMPDAYQIACKRFAEIGQAMDYPFGEDAADRQPPPTYLFRDFGYGVLRSGQGEDQSYLSMTFGKEAMFMGHAPAVKFGMVYYANGRLLTPMGAASYGRELCGGWSRRTIAHNAVNVDDRDQWGRTQGELVAFEPTPRCQVMRASDHGAYGSVTVDRTLFLTDAYVVDLSSARAEEGEHRYDLCYRVYGDWNCEKPARTRSGPLGIGYGYQYLTGVRSERTDDAWSAHWRQDKTSALRLSVLGEPNTEMITCTSPDNEDPDEEVAAVVARRWSRGTVFAAVWEPYRGRPFISQINRLQVRGKRTDSRGAAGVGVEVIREGETARECFMASYTPGPKTYGDIELDGELGAGRWSGREPEYMSLVKGILLRREGQSVEGSAPASIYVEPLTDEQLLVRMGSNGTGTLAVEGTLGKDVGVMSDGQAVETSVKGPSSLSFAVSEDATYTISGMETWHSVRLECEDATDREESAHKDAATVKIEVAAEGLAAGPPETDRTLRGKNKVANAGFEINHKSRGDVGEPWQCWSSYHFANFRAEYTYDDQIARGGGYSFKLEGSNWANESTRDAWIEQKVTGSGANKTYTLSAWVKSSLDPTRVRLCIYGWDPNWGNDFEGGVSPRFDIGTEWQRISWKRTFG